MIRGAHVCSLGSSADHERAMTRNARRLSAEHMVSMPSQLEPICYSKSKFLKPMLSVSTESIRASMLALPMLVCINTGDLYARMRATVFHPHALLTRCSAIAPACVAARSA